jgi:ABC-2 type transport system ATP-binding protein
LKQFIFPAYKPILTVSTVLALNGISKSYGKIQALNNVSFTIPQGSIFGILGPNGSGKTTMLSVVLNVLNADKGTYQWLEQHDNIEVLKKIGALLETPNFYHYLSAYDNLLITHAISGRGSKQEIDVVLEKVGLLERKKSKFSSYSLGMKQRLAIGAALLGSPKVLVLDEPTNGLDPVGIAEIRELIKSLAHEGNTIIMASHLLDEVEKVCTHVAILKKGNLVTTGSVDEVMVNEDVVELGSSDKTKLMEVLKNLAGYKSIKEESGLVYVTFSLGAANLAEINNHCFNNGVVLNHLRIKRKSLETKFFELTN